MSEIAVADSGHVRTITLNRPEVKNALSQELAWAILAAVAEAAVDDNVWVIAVTGSGDAFCAGLDLSPDNAPYSPLTPMDTQLDDLGWVSRLFLDLRHGCDKPIIAGINGVAVGAGLSLALAADIRIMARNARLMAGYPRIGASPDGGMTITLSQLIGYEQAMRFLLENRTVTGDEALALGMVGEVVDDGSLATRLAEYCQFIAERSPITARLTKRGLREATTSLNTESQLRFEVANIRRAFASDDAKEARKAFFEKRAPVFKGK
ncbi:MAG: enoyl-CoA hydratase/isomerase family protein [Dehalococcoidia bacterium]|nr:enoyl-CoA hydratase/isomerase family protein [Dehalococcoidia bacterium]MCA9853015.1 enoyl-CoA hydratase/isomerase family protein [Dehalococcoidia bacterium]